MTDTKTEDLLRKIRALRAKAADSSVTEEEAALFAEKVQELLARHGLEEASLEVEEVAGIEELDYEMQYCDAWHKAIIRAAVKLYFCEWYLCEHFARNRDGSEKLDARGFHVYRRGVRFVGRPHNVAVCREMVDYLISTTRRLDREYGTRADGRTEGAPARQFMRGCGDRLAHRLWEKYWAATRGSAMRSASGNPSNLPALYEDEATAVKKWVDENLSLSSRRARGAGTDGGHAAEGRRAAESVSLGGQIRGGAAGRLLS